MTKTKSNKMSVSLIQTIKVEFLVDLGELSEFPRLRWELEDQATKMLGDHAFHVIDKFAKRKRFEDWEITKLSSDVGVQRRSDFTLGE